ncbi:MAG TPA: NAD(P)H-dependent oxidoreductase subunit E [Thermoguttaceae bacterium]|nr:NAD(P)H-dependent oxidoreductase subunit E [Thermoguttaceae bacterium]
MTSPDEPTTDAQRQFVDQAVEHLGRAPDALIPILQAIQTQFRYLPEPALRRVCEITDITPAALTGVATFYDRFRHRPLGHHVIHVCHGTACHVKGAGVVHDAIHRRLNIPDGEDTDADGLFTVEKVACLGCCTLAPVVQIDGTTYGRLTPATVPEMLDDFLRNADRHASPTEPLVFDGPSLGEIRVGLGSCCVAQGSAKVHDALRRVLADTRIPATVKRVGCVGMCHQTPLVEIVPAAGPSSLYAHLTPDRVRRVVLRHFRPQGEWRRLRHRAADLLDRFIAGQDAAQENLCRPLDAHEGPVCEFLGPQRRVATEFCGHHDPTDLDEYLRHDGFAALDKSVNQMTPDAVIDEISRSGLRGRGGAGFPTGLKWQRVHEAPGELKYLICNGDEGDPGAFMDRMILESFPYRVIEGMAIAARAVGAREGFFYIRAEYPLAVQRIREAIAQCEARGILGRSADENTSKKFSLHLSIKEGAGAFVCGEETALLASLEGRRGMPRLRPPFPATSGLHGKPTLVNNVETFALVPWILRHGADAFAALGTAKSKGTKVFALAGKIRRGGLIEVPMGVTLRRIVDEIGGGVADGRQFKAVQVGGPSGGCVPAALADTPVDYEALVGVGAIMGSGGLVVLDDRDCMVDIARYFLQFTQDQSCGRCTFCRVGTRRMLDILDRLCTGHGRPTDLDTLETLAHTVRDASLCALGGTAPNPVLSTLKHFRDEYEAHLAGRCPAGRCKALITYEVTDRCIGCTLCAQHCPADAIPMTPYKQHAIDPQKCTRCDTCRELCPTQAIEIRSQQAAGSP